MEKLGELVMVRAEVHRKRLEEARADAQARRLRHEAERRSEEARTIIKAKGWRAHRVEHGDDMLIRALLYLLAVAVLAVTLNVCIYLTR